MQNPVYAPVKATSEKIYSLPTEVCWTREFSWRPKQIGWWTNGLLKVKRTTMTRQTTAICKHMHVIVSVCVCVTQINISYKYMLVLQVFQFFNFFSQATVFIPSCKE